MLRLIAFLMMFFPLMIFAQSFELAGELRPRLENRHGYKTLPSADDVPVAFISQRSRLYANYADDNVRVGFSLQDVRVWGDVPQLNVSDGHFSVHEAWGELLFTDNWSLKAGRQEIVYDDSRIFGNVGWAQQGRSHDAAILKYNRNNFRFHAGGALNQDSEKLFRTFYAQNNYKTFQYLWGNYNKDAWSLSLLFLNNGLESQNQPEIFEINYSQTFGGRFEYNLDAVQLAAAGYLQRGEAWLGTDLEAHYFKIDVMVPLTDKLMIAAGNEFLSGNDMQNTSSETNKAFTPFYGTNHKFNGWMDYFYVGNHTNSVGLNDQYFHVNYSSGDFSASATTHLFNSAGNIYSISSQSRLDKYLGTETDLQLKYTFSNNTILSAGYSRMFGTESLEYLKGGDAEETADWLWLMITIKPKFL
ncbi:MAG: hypothetical protein U5L09_21150 [Bacteroidales bacterium]|nr:hypothetical protein [Bacteroidales bacterium]